MAKEIIRSLAGALKSFNRLLFVDKGEYIASHKLLLKWPSDIYQCVIPSYCARLMKDKNDFINDFEKSFEKIIKQIDFENNFVVLIKAEEGARSIKHYHITTEKITLLSGKAIEEISGDTLVEGTSYHIDSFTPHQLCFSVDSFGVSEIPKYFTSERVFEEEWQPENITFLNKSFQPLWTN